MKILDKLQKAFFIVGDHMADEEMFETRHFFHRTKKLAFFVGATRLDGEGYLPGEKDEGIHETT
jgi:hypothetical protein